jgi:RecA-family ATPase
VSDHLLNFVRAAELEQAPRDAWLIQHLWGSQAVGCLGGPPKAGKSWLGLDLAVSVASATPCLGRFEVLEPGASLIYMAEDALPAVRQRIEGICRQRQRGVLPARMRETVASGE